MIVVDTEVGKVAVNPEHIIAIAPHPEVANCTVIVCRDEMRIQTTMTVEDVWNLIMVE